MKANKHFRNGQNYSYKIFLLLENEEKRTSRVLLFVFPFILSLHKHIIYVNIYIQSLPPFPFQTQPLPPLDHSPSTQTQTACLTALNTHSDLLVTSHLPCLCLSSSSSSLYFCLSSTLSHNLSICPSHPLLFSECQSVEISCFYFFSWRTKGGLQAKGGGGGCSKSKEWGL